MGKKVYFTDGKEIFEYLTDGKESLTAERCVPGVTRAASRGKTWRAAKVRMDIIYDNNTTILLGVVGQMGASMAAGRCAPAE